MTPNINNLKRLLTACQNRSPILLKPLCNLVCKLPRHVLESLQPPLSGMIDGFTVFQVKNSVIQHCRKFGIYLNPQTQAPVIPEVVSQAEPCQVLSDIPPLECNFQEPNHSQNNYDKSISSSSNNSKMIYSSNSNSDIGSMRSRCIISENLQTSTPLEGSGNLQYERSLHEVEGSDLVEGNGGDETVQGVVANSAAPPMLERNVSLLPPTPTSLPPSGSSEPLDNQPKQKKAKAKTFIKPDQPKELAPTGRELQHPQQPVVKDSSNTKDESVTDINLRGDAFNLQGLLLTPESAATPANKGRKKLKRRHDFTADSNILEPKPFSPVAYPGSHTAGQSGPSEPLRRKQGMYEESTNNKFSSVGKTSLNFPKALEKDIKLEDEIPQFCVVKKKKFLKTTSEQLIKNVNQKLNQRSDLNSLPPFDATTYMDVEDNSGLGKPQKFLQECEQIFRNSSDVTVALPKEQPRSCLTTRNSSCHQTSRSWKCQEDYEQSPLPAQLSHLSSVPCNTQQNQW